MQTWQECFDAKMSAHDAAAHLGKNAAAAYNWATRAKVKWPKIPKEEHSKRVRQAIARRKGTSDFRGPNAEPAISRSELPPEQERHGGRYWATNSKTGERITKVSLRGLYVEAQLRGWTDWEWGDRGDVQGGRAI